ncbi:Phenylacetic acid degradation-related protein [Marinobacter sp. BSs20148]|nr:Phenylacetic acid degradation-related protein [Marinobacter sp. BSs20148]
MAIWTRTPTKEDLLKSCQNTAVSHMGIEFLEVGDNFLKGRMPVDKRTVQPFGVLHGGSSVLLAETLGSMAANYCLRDQGTVAVALKSMRTIFAPSPTAGFTALRQRFILAALLRYGT